jgi:Terminase large subunit, T4likevirus-type, N-terminal
MNTSPSPTILLKPPQWMVFNHDARFRILVAGRRFGKTYLSMVELCRAAWSTGRLVWYVAPTYRQAKRITWKPLKQMTRRYWATQPNETDLRIELTTGGTICLRGADNYDSLRGDGLDFLILDEYASIAREAWPEVLRPALADKQGSALFIGTPRGHDHFYDLYQWAATQPHWERFQFTTEQGGNVSQDELQAATHELDERTYRQEFQASFENLTTGRAYFAFDRARNVERLQFNPNLPLFWSLDFNVNPMCSVIGQRGGDFVHILAELALADSNTFAACEHFLNRIGQFARLSPFTTRIQVYGDATGSGRQTCASRTDWQIVRDFFTRYPYPVEYRVSSSNPPVKDRINCVNAMLCNQAGDRRLLVHPDCKELILDLERLRWKSDPSGNLLPAVDKSDPARSHASDALGYMIARDFGMRPQFGEMPGLMQ